MWTIYISVCSQNGKAYVGQTCGTVVKRRWTHENRKDYGAFFHRAIRKYGKHGFDWGEFARVTTKEEADNLEKILITLLRTTDRNYGYNQTAGGDGSIGWKQSEETKVKRGQTLKRLNAEGKVRRGRGYKRKPHSESTIQKISASLRARPLQPRKICSVHNCGNFTHSGGMCASHYGRLIRYGDPLKGRPLGVTGPPKGVKYGPRSGVSHLSKANSCAKRPTRCPDMRCD